MKRCFTSLTALLCSAAILLCSLPVSVLSTDNRSGDFTYSVLPDNTAREAACFRRGR